MSKRDRSPDVNGYIVANLIDLPAPSPHSNARFEEECQSNPSKMIALLLGGKIKAGLRARETLAFGSRAKPNANWCGPGFPV